MENRASETRPFMRSYPFGSHFDTQVTSALEAVINVRCPKEFPFLENEMTVSDFREAVDT
jgi:hypothetical protein